ncbi:hypothetical protein WT15_23920 [Burkholderia stagnalis]|uniref:XkdW family protein n=1 Tax=Burkholderia stagnalis TaxID=1503054 RepID=UPI000754180F|nr:XkdW family protein [Burkholderia stagnalis]KVN73891.1 hypothetical protein WT15_23920 [Burkholderia stagnalis]KWO27065.1 hypothetical protein WT96_31315 [Burkholderia stagnalis]KWO45062.1 hypothetical protein WT95_26955 [Burkholderia stagnalis]
MDICQTIKYLYPDARAGIDFFLEDHGDGPIIAWWSMSQPQPTVDQLNAEWQACQLSIAKTASIAALNAACQTAIVAGFTSSALGVSTFYPTTDTDQRNLQSSALAAAWNAGTAGWRVSLWCQQGDAWAYVTHTAQQVQQVNADWVTFRASAQQKYAAAIDQVNAATTVDAVRAVVV